MGSGEMPVSHCSQGDPGPGLMHSAVCLLWQRFLQALNPLSASEHFRSELHRLYDLTFAGSAGLAPR